SLVDASTGRTTDLGPVAGDAPAWSPDGTHIVYGVRGGAVYAVSVNGGDPSLLAQLPGAGPDWFVGVAGSPDGAHAAILVHLVDGRRRLYVMDADGSSPRVLVDDFEPGGWGLYFPGDPAQSIAWSPDGTRLTYPTFSGPNDRVSQIWTVG